jgi:low affinity Fe/Cu permease
VTEIAKPVALPELPSDRESPFEKIADWVSEAMGRPTNITVWFILVISWTLVFALGGSHLASGTWMPSWFTSTGFNFPLNLITTVAELFIGFLVAAAANRSQRVLSHTLAQIIALVKLVVTITNQIEMVEDGLRREITVNTNLTKQVHLITTEVKQTQDQQLLALEGITHINAELDLIRQVISPSAVNPAAGIDTSLVK